MEVHPTKVNNYSKYFEQSGRKIAIPTIPWVHVFEETEDPVLSFSKKIVNGNAYPLNYPKYGDNTTNQDVTESCLQGKNTSR